MRERGEQNSPFQSHPSMAQQKVSKQKITAKSELLKVQTTWHYHALI